MLSRSEDLGTRGGGLNLVTGMFKERKKKDKLSSEGQIYKKIIFLVRVKYTFAYLSSKWVEKVLYRMYF